MSLARVNPLQALITRAADAPTSTGIVARYERRATGAGSQQVVLADVSASMSGSAGSGRRKIDVLREALEILPYGCRLVAFSTTATEVARASLMPSPNGGTALHVALDMAATMRPARTLVVSDGEPDSEREALAAADRMPGVIDVIYCGDPSNMHARGFLMRLARVGCGRYDAHDIVTAPHALGPAVRGLLGAAK